jgi:hypothetical protein
MDQQNKCYGVIIFTTVVMRSVWLTRNDMVFNNQVSSGVRFFFEKDLVPNFGVETYHQGGEDGGDDIMVVFFGEADLGAIADRKRMKLTTKSIHQVNWAQQGRADGEGPRVMEMC